MMLPPDLKGRMRGLEQQNADHQEMDQVAQDWDIVVYL